MYCFSNNRTDNMQENDPVIVNQNWRSLLLNVVHWNIYGEILLNQRRKKETFQKHLTLFSSSQFPAVVSLIEYVLTKGSACFSSYPDIETKQIMSLLWFALATGDVKSWLGILHLSLCWTYRQKHRVQSSVSLWVAVKNRLCSLFLLNKTWTLRSCLDFHKRC